jgi:virginiamycin B lyase
MRAPKHGAWILASGLFLFGCAHGGGQSVATSAIIDARSIQAATAPDLRQTDGPYAHWHFIRHNQASNANDDQLVVDAGRRVWFTETQSNAVAYVDMNGNVQDFPVSGYVNGGIAYGPSHLVWFTAYGFVGSMSLTGAVTEYPTPGFNPQRIVVGPDGNLWITLDTPNFKSFAIGKLTPSGTLTTFAASDITRGITLGGDGNLWFTTGNHKIDKIAPATGVITEYPIDPSFYVFDICTGKDGNIYAVSDTNLGIMTTSGSFSEVANASMDMMDLAPGPSGAIWIVGQDTTLSKWMVSEYASGRFANHTYPKIGPVVGGVPLGGVVYGPDRNVWFLAEGTGAQQRPPPPFGMIGTYIRLVMTTTPQSLTFTGPGQSQVVSVSETDYNGGFTARSSNPAVVSVTTGPAPDSFTVTSTGAGSAKVIVSDGVFNSSAVPATVQ